VALTKEQMAKGGRNGKRGKATVTPEFIHYLAGPGSVKAYKILAKMQGAEYIEYFAKLAPYAFPKLAALQVDANISGDIGFKLIHPDDALIDDI